MKDRYGKWVYECETCEWEDWYAEIYRRQFENRPIVPPWLKSLILQWNGLPTHMVDRLRCPESLEDDCRAEGFRKLCEVAIKWNPNRGQFSTIAYLSLYRHVARWLEVEKAKRLMTDLDVDKFAVPNSGFAEVERLDRLRGCKAKIESLGSRVPHDDFGVVSEYYGVGGCRPMTLNEIAQVRKVSKERVRQRLKRGLQKMRELAGA